MSDDKEQPKRVRKLAEDPFEAAGYDLVQIRFQIEKLLKSFSDKDRRNPNYKQFLKDITDEVEKALNFRPGDHNKETLRSKILDYCSFVSRNKIFLAILCIVLGAILGNIEILKAILHLFKD
jgi:hypothetical protein